ncbi:MAG: S-layer homology domain-containing protein [Candidatus Fermentithermobacillus carboniphilus]|uniref:S-layer homology domain-containing protein n=1 Tax=Candidatus Fermentithermobacillus carboniphilus TaxID=3085328 RepID=A0AAT9LE42_9FIRM|nr:MAG: S-layer homology domain-containing protein [Candidatus Fermentithermobacillus carboniphilus]
MSHWWSQSTLSSHRLRCKKSLGFWGKKATLAFLIVTALISSFLPSLARAQTLFSDIEGHWAEHDIVQMARMGVVNGYEDGTFRPDSPVSREEAIKMVFSLYPEAKKLAKELSVFQPDYPDVRNTWARDFLECALGIVPGYTDFTFRPKEPMSRLDAVILILKAKFLAEGKTGSFEYGPFVWLPQPDKQWVEKVRTSPEARAIGSGDDQVDEVNLYIPMAFLMQSNIIRGYGTTLGWQDPVTRAQMCILLRRIAEYQIPAYGSFVSFCLHDGTTVHPVNLDKEEAEKALERAGTYYRTAYPDEYQRARVIYDSVALNFQYDYASLKNMRDQTPIQVMARGAGVCQGIADLYTLLAQKAGLKAETVTGWAKNPTISGGHAWVRLTLSNRTVYCDPTWGMSGQIFFDNLEDYRSKGAYDWKEGPVTGGKPPESKIPCFRASFNFNLGHETFRSPVSNPSGSPRLPLLPALMKRVSRQEDP